MSSPEQGADETPVHSPNVISNAEFNCPITGQHCKVLGQLIRKLGEEHDSRFQARNLLLRDTPYMYTSPRCDPQAQLCAAVFLNDVFSRE